MSRGLFRSLFRKQTTDEQLASVNGGACDKFNCPICGNSRVNDSYVTHMFHGEGGYKCECQSCGYAFDVEA